MSQILYNRRCRCKEIEKLSLTKKRKTPIRSGGKPLKYPESEELLSKTFYIKYDTCLSATAKLILNSFQAKYFYYALDDILYLLKFNLNEQKNLLATLYSPVLSIHNNLSINFFDIWIEELYIHEVPKNNKFLEKQLNYLSYSNHITLKLVYKPKPLLKTQDSLW